MLQSINNFSILSFLFQLLELFRMPENEISIISKSYKILALNLEIQFIEILFYIKIIIFSVIFIKINFHFLHSEEESTFYN